MKKLIILLLTLFTTTLFAQTTDSWVNFKVQFDFYAPSESNFFMVENGSGSQVFFHQPTVAYEYLDTTILVNSGSYTVTLNDSYGDGWISQSPAHFKMSNTCQGLIIDWDPVLGSFFTRDTTVNVLPCPPPPGAGCTNPLATNYDSTATMDDGSCIYPPCAGLDTLWGEFYCNIANVTLHYHWLTGPNPNCQMVSYTRSDNPNDLWGYGHVYPYPSNWGNTGLISSNKQPNTTYYFQGMLADSSLTDTIVITTGECNVGCTDPTALNYNPWAQIDDGTCQLPPANCVGGESNIVVTVIPDTYPGETSWEITDTNGTVLATSPPYQITGVPVITETCVPNGTAIVFNLYDSFGDGMAGTEYGGVDGTALVQTLCGDTILAILPGNANFGNDTITSPYIVQPCTPNSIPGCMDPGYTEYNPQANVNDSSCVTPVVLGCIDSTSPDYDPLANTMSIIPNCQYTLVITDAAEDGWFGSWLGILQDTTVLGPFQMGPNDGYSQTFTISLSAMSPVEIMFFAPGNSSTTASQCGFYLIGPEGDTTLSGGTNAWTDPMLQFPYRYNAVPYCGNYCTPGVVGCMDSTALNYNPLANMPDVCTPIVLGCTNSLAFNYNPLANVDDSTCVAIVIGCMDTTAFNFNPSANTNDQSSCIPVIYGCMSDTMFNYNPAANTDDGSCIPVIFGCTDSNAVNYNYLANTNNGSCIPVILGCTDPNAFNYDPIANTSDSSCIPFIYGCTDAMMWNYNSNANTDNGSCLPYLYGCTDSTQYNYDPLANTDNGTCVAFIYGCTDSTAFNYNNLANTNDGTCIPVLLGCTDSTSINYNALANTDDGTCIAELLGCTDSTALNYNPLANTDDGTCIPFIYGCTDSTMFNYDPTANTDDGSCIAFIYGCTDPTMFNYNSLANCDDGSCVAYVYGCTDPIMFNYDSLANTDNGSCIPVIFGCIDSTMYNYDPTANTDNGTCISFIYGCTDNTAFNYNPLANTLDNSCCYISGCTDSTALNYNSNACYDDGSCIIAVIGCTDVAAYNYNPSANVSDSTACLYDAGCYGGPGIPYWLNDGCYAWVIDVDDYCCTNDWDASCQSMYDYCQLGWPTSIEDISALGIIVYPNPTKDVITIETRLDIEVELYDMIGNKVISESNAKRLDLSKLSNGIYNMSILYNNVRYSKKVIKQ